jgi:hypothetical protein
MPIRMNAEMAIALLVSLAVHPGNTSIMTNSIGCLPQILGFQE